MQKENKMGVMPIKKLVITMSVPMMISMLVQALYNIVDSLYVARISETQNELTAISLAFAAQNFMIAVASGTGVGINALLSKSLGEKDYKKALLCTQKEYARRGFGTIQDGSQTGENTLALYKRVYEAEDWTAFRGAVNNYKEQAEKSYIFEKK